MLEKKIKLGNIYKSLSDSHVFENVVFPIIQSLRLYCIFSRERVVRETQKITFVNNPNPGEYSTVALNVYIPLYVSQIE